MSATNIKNVELFASCKQRDFSQEHEKERTFTEVLPAEKQKGMQLFILQTSLHITIYIDS